MSMLVGVRGQTRESEGAALREGIIQQPGPFYNGNPSSIIWGNPPTAALWRDESAPPFSSSTPSDFDISEHPLQKEEKDKFGAGMVAGEGKASSKGRRHVVRTQFTRNPNPNPSSSPSSPFAFGFPSHTPPASASTSVPQFGISQIPPQPVPSGSSFMAFGSNINYTPGASATRIDASVPRPGALPSVQDERMEDIEDVIPAVANLSMNDHPKLSVKAGEHVASSGVGKDASIPRPIVAGKFSGHGLNSSSESLTDRKDVAGVFVFGAKPSSFVAPSGPPNPPVAQPTASRSRTVKVKRSASAAKGKGIAAGNGALGAPSFKGLHVEGSQSVSGECSFSQPNLGVGVPVAQNAECTSDDSSSQGFASSSSLPVPLHEDSVLKGLHQSSPDEVHSPSGPGQRNFFFSEIARGSQSSGESNARSEPSFLSEPSFKSNEFDQTSTVGHNILLPSAFTRVANNMGSLDGSFSSSQSLEASFAGLNVNDNSSKKNSGKLESASGYNDVNSSLHSVEDLSSGLALKLGLGSVGSAFDKEVTADSTAVGKPSMLFNTEAVGSSENGTPTPNLVSRDARATGVKEDGDTLQSSSSSPTNTVDFLRMAKETTFDAQKHSIHAFTHDQPEPFTAQAQPETFVFGASQPQFTTTRPEEPPPFPFTFTAKACSSVSSSTGGGCVSKGENKSVSDFLAFKQKGSDTCDSSLPSQVDTDAVTTSFSYFNLGATKPPVKDDSRIDTQGGLSGLKVQDTATPFASGANVKTDSDGECSSYVTAASHFVFSAGSSSPSSSQATAPMGTAAKGNGASSAPAADNIVSNKFVSTGNAGSSEYFEAQLRSQPSNSSSKSFEFRANHGDSGSTGKVNTPRKKGNRTQFSVPRRQSRSSTTVKEKTNSGTFINFVDNSVAPDEAGSPMDFSPQRYTPPDDSVPDVEHIAKPTSWSHNQSMEKDGLDGDDEWAQYSETDVAMENLRNAANDLTLGSKPGSQDAWEGIGKGEDESFWWGGNKENSPAKASGRNGKWKRAAFDENQVPLSGRDNTWADIKLHTTNEHESAASSSTPSVDSSASSTGWGHFTFTAGSSPNSSTTSLLKRHARRIQREKPAAGFSEALKSSSSKVRGVGISSAHPGVSQGVGASASATGGAAMKRPVFAFDVRTSNPESGKGFMGRGGNWANEQPKVPSAIFSSRSNSWSTESSSSMGSLPRADGLGPFSPQTAGAAATEQVCERWRLRGNQAYANGDFPKAEEYYSRGASSVPPNETSQSCIRASMLCYSNRAATRMVVGRMREALADCMRAMAVDPNFLRVRLRAASCHLALGEIGPAVLAFKECIRRTKEDDQPDVKVSSEASEGLRKSLQVEEYVDRASEILANWSSGDTPTALRLLNEAILSSPHSERALELKSRALLLLRRYDEVVQLCEQSLVTTERNHPLTSSDQIPSAGDPVKHLGATSPLKAWRWRLTAKAKYHLGRLEEALELLQKLDEVMTSDKAASTGPLPTADPASLAISNIRDLLRHKAAGNEAFQNGKHAEAVEHYSAALACNGDSRPFNAVCLCNRAAASQALGNIADAIADCSRAIALDPKYAKAISRRATLHEKVRDYGQSCHDLQRLITLLEGQQQVAKVTLSPARAGRSSTNTQQDLRQARDRLAKAEEEMKKGHPLDHYMILGLEPTCSSNEIKKAYRKAALRHHPDKAGQFLARNEGGDDGGLWKEVGDEVRRDAERLFKLIGEANAILSDTQRRTRYDAEEEFRKLRTRTSSATGGLSEMYRSTERGQGGVGRRPRDGWDSWNSYQNQRWHSGPDAAQPDTYARRGRYGSNSSSRSNGDGGRWTDFDWDDI